MSRPGTDEGAVFGVLEVTGLRQVPVPQKENLSLHCTVERVQEWRSTVESTWVWNETYMGEYECTETISL